MKYSGNPTKCDKCGCDVADTKYIGCTPGTSLKIDMLERRCYTCKYTWREFPLDHKENN